LRLLPSGRNDPPEAARCSDPASRPGIPIRHPDPASRSGAPIRRPSSGGAAASARSRGRRRLPLSAA